MNFDFCTSNLLFGRQSLQDEFSIPGSQDGWCVLYAVLLLAAHRLLISTFQLTARISLAGIFNQSQQKVSRLYSGEGTGIQFKVWILWKANKTFPSLDWFFCHLNLCVPWPFVILSKHIPFHGMLVISLLLFTYFSSIISYIWKFPSYFPRGLWYV